MWNRLILLWNKFRAWLSPHPELPAHPDSMAETYHPSNLHARRYR